MFSAQVEEGLELRLLELRHAEALFDLVDKNREHLSNWFPFVERAYKVENSERFIRRGLDRFAKGDGFRMGIWTHGELAGLVQSHYISARFLSTGLGYWLGAEYGGRGVMTKACRYLCAYLFRERKLNRIEISCSENNIKSRRLAERLGFTLEGKLRQMGYTKDGLTDYLIYGLLAEDRR